MAEQPPKLTGSRSQGIACRRGAKGLTSRASTASPANSCASHSRVQRPCQSEAQATGADRPSAIHNRARREDFAFSAMRHPLPGFGLGAGIGGASQNRPFHVGAKFLARDACDSLDHRAVLCRDTISLPLKHDVVGADADSAGQSSGASSQLNGPVQSGDRRGVHAPIIDRKTILARTSINTMG